MGQANEVQKMRQETRLNFTHMRLREEEMTGITFSATVNKIATTIDGGWRITIDVSNSETDQVMALSEVRNKVLQIGIVEVADDRNRDS